MPVGYEFTVPFEDTELGKFKALMASLKQTQRERDLMFEMLDREITRLCEAEHFTEADIDFLARAKRVLEGRP